MHNIYYINDIIKIKFSGKFKVGLFYFREKIKPSFKVMYFTSCYYIFTTLELFLIVFASICFHYF